MNEPTDKQKRFVDEYLIDMNATQAAIRAGYSQHTANEQGARLLANVSLQDYLNEQQAIRGEKTGITQEWVINNLRAIAERCMVAEPVMDKQGNPTGEYIFNAAGANKSLELIGKHVGMFSDKLKISIEKPVLEISDYGSDNYQQAQVSALAETKTRLLQ